MSIWKEIGQCILICPNTSLWGCGDAYQQDLMACLQSSNLTTKIHKSAQQQQAHPILFLFPFNLFHAQEADLGTFDRPLAVKHMLTSVFSALFMSVNMKHFWLKGRRLPSEQLQGD